jgi:putative transposase
VCWVCGANALGLIFFRNHREGLVGMGFFTVPTVSFGLLWVFVVLHHERRRIVHFSVTKHPEAPWVIQQLREAFPFDTAPRHAILDRDGKCGLQVPESLRRLRVKPVRTALRSPWQNPYVERFGGTLRRELLDKIIVFNQAQLRESCVNSLPTTTRTAVTWAWRKTQRNPGPSHANL